MGGYGSGRWGSGHARRTTVEDCLSLNVSRLHRNDMLQDNEVRTDYCAWRDVAGRLVARVRVEACANDVTLYYTLQDPRSDRRPEEVHCTALITWTPCNFGGERPWFVCPGWHCGRRVATLHLPRLGSGREWRCRHCYALAYTSQYQGRDERLFAKARRIRQRLGEASGTLGQRLPPKPAGMHETTYARLREQHNQALEMAQCEMAAILARVEDRLRKLLGPGVAGHEWLSRGSDS
jgi:hypothetical protein